MNISDVAAMPESSATTRATIPNVDARLRRVETDVEIAAFEKPEQGPCDPPAGVRERGRYTSWKVERKGVWSHLPPEVDRRGDQQTVDEVDAKRANERNDEIRLRRRSIPFDECAHVGHGIRGGPQHESAETAGHDD